MPAETAIARENAVALSRVLVLKGLLTSNVYLPVFFPLLLSVGLSEHSIYVALAVGTASMVVGDGATAWLVDRFGPKRPIVVASGIQASAILLLPFVGSLQTLLLVEVLVGLSFPAIHGADSKWIRGLAAKGRVPYSERGNQAALWLSQLISVGLGAFLVSSPFAACAISSVAYLVGGALAFSLPDSEPAVVRHHHRASAGALSVVVTMARQPLAVLSMVALACTGASAWLFQFAAYRVAAGDVGIYALIQCLAAATTLSGSLSGASLRRSRMEFRVIVGLVIVLMSCAFLSWIAGHSIVFLALVAPCLFLRGLASVVGRSAVGAAVPVDGPVAQAVFAFNAATRLIQAALTSVFSFMR